MSSLIWIKDGLLPIVHLVALYSASQMKLSQTTYQASASSVALHWTPRDDVAVELRAFHAAKDRFCDQLEAIADLLPDSVDVRDCLIISRRIVPIIKRAHDFEEHIVFPMLVSGHANQSEVTDWLERLKFEHLGDEDFAADLCLALQEFAVNTRGANIESLSWMLRGFFEGLRRHVAFERCNVLPLLEGRRAT